VSLPLRFSADALRNRRAAGFAVGAAIPLALAFDDGGYDVLTREKLGLLLWAAIALGFAVGVLPRGRLTRGAWVALGSLAALALLTALSLAWTESRERTFEELARVLQYGGLVTLAFTALNRHTWRGAAAGLATAALVAPVLSLTARLAPDLITDHTARAFHTDRLSYPLGYWNAVAAWGAIAIAIGLAWSAHARETLTRSLALAAVPVAALSVYLTYSRGGVIASAIAVVAAVGFARHRWTTAVHALVAGLGSAAAVLVTRDHSEIARATGDRGAASVVGVLALAAAVCAVAAVATRAGGLDRLRLSSEANRVVVPVAVVLVAAAVGVGLHGQLSDAWQQFRDQRTVSAGADPTARLGSLGGNRYEVWQTAIDAFQSEPVGGIGPGTFESFWAREGDSPEFLRDAHSLYLETLAELGVPGALALMVFLTSLLATGLAARREIPHAYELGASAAATAAFVTYLFSAGVDWMWEVPAIGALAIGSMAVACTAAFPRWGRRPLGAAPRAAIIVVAVAAAAVQVPPLVSVERLRASADELRSGGADRAVELADQAVRAEPWAAAPYVQRALSEQQQGDLAAARADLQKAVEKEPANWRHHFLLARLEAQAGNRAATVFELEQVRRLAPNSVFLVPGNPARGQIDAVLSG
jgi:hypothetical protein